jgi:DNA modification methylase
LNQLTPSGCLWPTPRWLNWWSSSGYESPRWLQLWCSSRYVCPQWWSRWLQVDVYGPSMIELVTFKWMPSVTAAMMQQQICVPSVVNQLIASGSV